MRPAWQGLCKVFAIPTRADVVFADAMCNKRHCNSRVERGLSLKEQSFFGTSDVFWGSLETARYSDRVVNSVSRSGLCDVAAGIAVACMLKSKACRALKKHLSIGREKRCSRSPPSAVDCNHGNWQAPRRAVAFLAGRAGDGEGEPPKDLADFSHLPE